MKLYCRICNVFLGEIQEGKIATKKLVCLCNKCYRNIKSMGMDKNKTNQKENIQDFMEKIYRNMGI